MKRYNFYIPIYDFKAVLLYAENREDEPVVVRALKQFHCTQADIEEIGRNIREDCFDGAITLSHKHRHMFVCVFYPINSKERFIVCRDHEKRHIEDRVAEYCGVEDFEAIAYLAGFLGSHFNKFEQIIMNSDVPEH